MRRWQLSKRDRKKLISLLQSKYDGMGGLLDKLRDSNIEKVVEEDMVIYLVDGRAAFIELGEDDVIPHLFLLLHHGYGWLPYIVVDEGAVQPISRGADLMRPGIVEFHGEFKEGDILVVVDPKHRLPLAVHRALMDRASAEAARRGRVSKSLHHVGDRFWKLAKTL
jgi:PUA-domain protein